MGKIRVYQVAKLLKITADEAVDLLRRNGAEVKSNLSSVDEKFVTQLQSKSASRGRGETSSEETPPSPTRPQQPVPKTTRARPATTAPKKTAAKVKPQRPPLEKATPSATTKSPIRAVVRQPSPVKAETVPAQQPPKVPRFLQGPPRLRRQLRRPRGPRDPSSCHEPRPSLRNPVSWRPLWPKGLQRLSARSQYRLLHPVR